MSASLVEIEAVRYAWPRARGFTLEIPRFAMARGERVLLVGSSGAGKSTLLALVAGIVTPDAGTIRILGEDIGRLVSARRDRFRAEHIGVIFQMFNLLPYGTPVDNVLLPLSFARSRRERVGSRMAQANEARRLLERLGLDVGDMGSPRAASLSVGQQQRVAAARALIGRPELILADEPTSALDFETTRQFLDLLFGEIQASGAGLLMVSHDLSLAPRFDRMVPLAELFAARPGRCAPEAAI